MRIPLAIAFGGALGCLSRYWVGLALLGASAAFPVNTLVINVLGSFALGVTAATLPGPSVARAGLGVGFCGGFTTFSAFSVELVALLDRGDTGRATTYVAASVLLSAAAAWAGILVGRALVAR